MDTHPNLAAGTFTHSTLLLLSLEYPNIYHHAHLDRIGATRTFFIQLMLAMSPTLTHPSFPDDTHLKFETFYSCPYCSPPFLQVAPIRLHKISSSLNTFRPIWSSLTFASNTKIGPNNVEDCGVIRAINGYSCRFDNRRIATISQILNFSIISLSDPVNGWRYGEIELRTFSLRYSGSILNRLQYHGEKG